MDEVKPGYKTTELAYGIAAPAATMLVGYLVKLPPWPFVTVVGIVSFLAAVYMVVRLVAKTPAKVADTLDLVTLASIQKAVADALTTMQKTVPSTAVAK